MRIKPEARCAFVLHCTAGLAPSAATPHALPCVYHLAAQLQELQRRSMALEAQVDAARAVDRERQLQIRRLQQALDLRVAELRCSSRGGGGAGGGQEAQEGEVEEHEGLSAKVLHSLAGN